MAIRTLLVVVKVLPHFGQVRALSSSWFLQVGQVFMGLNTHKQIRSRGGGNLLALAMQTNRAEDELARALAHALALLPPESLDRLDRRLARCRICWVRESGCCCDDEPLCASAILASSIATKAESVRLSFAASTRNPSLVSTSTKAVSVTLPSANLPCLLM